MIHICSCVMGPTSLETPRPPKNTSTFDIAIFAIGVVLVPSLEKLRRILKSKEIECEDLESNY